MKKTITNSDEELKRNEKGNFGYPPAEDIYSRGKVEENIDPEDISRLKENQKDPGDEGKESELDVPGAELDDDMEKIGAEDEENNEYSIGGDNHSDLDENNPDIQFPSE
jgi:hypothetical protein